MPHSYRVRGEGDKLVESLRLLAQDYNNPMMQRAFSQTVEVLGGMTGKSIDSTLKDFPLRYVAPIYDPCYDEKTEVLTNRGFIFFKDLNYDDEICTLNTETKEIEYQKPEPNSITIKDYNGAMYWIKTKRSKIDLMVTPNHRMYVMDWKGDWKFVTARDVYGSDVSYTKVGDWKGEDEKWFILPSDTIKFRCKGYKNTPKYNSTRTIPERKIPMDDWLEFLGYYISEGCCINMVCEESGKRQNGYAISIKQKDIENREKIIKSCKKVVTGEVYNKDELIVIRDKQIYLYLSKFGKSYEKYIPREVMDLSKRQLTILYDALMLGDGRSTNEGGSYYSTSSVRLRDNFQELLLKVGYSGTYTLVNDIGKESIIRGRIIRAKHKGWRVLIKTKRNIYTMYPHVYRKKGQTVDGWIKYKGKIYCAIVPNHTMYVRRNGCVVWCGNSGYAEASRNYILALDKLGVDVFAEPLKFWAREMRQLIRPSELAKLIQLCIKKGSKRMPLIQQSTPEWFPKENDMKVKIGYTPFETTKIPDEWVDFCGRMDEMWTSCEFSRQAFINGGFPQDKIKVFYHGVNSKLYNPALGMMDIPGKAGFNFLSVFQWSPRKNPDALIEAYFKEFKYTEDVSLMLRTYGSNESSQERDRVKAEIKKVQDKLELKKIPKIVFIGGFIKAEDMPKMYNSADCYLAISSGEGWGLPASEAASCGVPVIYTDWSSFPEFLNTNIAYPVKIGGLWEPSGEMHWVTWYRPGMKLCKNDVGDLRKQMRYVFEHQDRAKEKGIAARKEMADNWAWGAQAQKMKDRLRELIS